MIPISPSGCRYFLNKIRRKCFPATLPAPTEAEEALITRLRNQLNSLPEPVVSENVTVAENTWSQFRAMIHTALLENDPREFPRFDVIQETMFVDHPGYIATEFQQLRDSPQWNARWRDAIAESKRVLVPRCPFYWGSSGNMIHYAFHLAEFERQTGATLSDIHSVEEFGGGYGGMCRLFRRLGDCTSYTIRDLPELCALQQFFLEIDALGDETAARRQMAVNWMSGGEKVEREPIDLFIATWSISETPLDFRTAFLDQVDAHYFLIGYQGEFQDIDNVKFFRDWSGCRTGWHWINVPIHHMPGSQHYLFGIRNDPV